MEEGEKKPGADAGSGDSQKKIVYAVIAVAVVILAVVLVAKFGFGADLLNPAGGQMSLIQRQPVMAKATINMTSISPCQADQTGCSGRCVNIQTDWHNCGKCGNICPEPRNAVPYCWQGTCTWKCLDNYRFCGNTTEGCVPIFNDDNHCGNCNTVCGTGSWCNNDECRAG